MLALHANHTNTQTNDEIRASVWLWLESVWRNLSEIVSLDTKSVILFLFCLTALIDDMMLIDRLLRIMFDDNLPRILGDEQPPQPSPH